MNVLLDAELAEHNFFDLNSSVKRVSSMSTRGQYKIETSEHFIRIEQTPHPCLQNDKQSNSNNLTEKR